MFTISASRYGGNPYRRKKSTEKQCNGQSRGQRDANEERAAITIIRESAHNYSNEACLVVLEASELNI